MMTIQEIAIVNARAAIKWADEKKNDELKKLAIQVLADWEKPAPIIRVTEPRQKKSWFKKKG